ncbi:MAG: hypothetical protein KGK14_12345, partial [Bacteroidota bacterium]|jgi:hypothetical protein|nr:hypothetical protein [Bacteroidota bacterium]
MTGQLMQWLKKGVNLAVAVQRLIDTYLPQRVVSAVHPPYHEVAGVPLLAQTAVGVLGVGCSNIGIAQKNTTQSALRSLSG